MGASWMLPGEYAILQRCHSAVLDIHAILQPIRICFFATSNTKYIFARFSIVFVKQSNTKNEEKN